MIVLVLRAATRPREPRRRRDGGEPDAPRAAPGQPRDRHRDLAADRRCAPRASCAGSRQQAADTPAPAAERIALEGVSFAYPGSERDRPARHLARARRRAASSRSSARTAPASRRSSSSCSGSIRRAPGRSTRGGRTTAVFQDFQRPALTLREAVGLGDVRADRRRRGDRRRARAHRRAAARPRRPARPRVRRRRALRRPVAAARARPRARPPRTPSRGPGRADRERRRAHRAPHLHAARRRRPLPARRGHRARHAPLRHRPRRRHDRRARARAGSSSTAPTSS